VARKGGQHTQFEGHSNATVCIAATFADPPFIGFLAQNISKKSIVNRDAFSYGSPQMHRFWCLSPTVLVSKSINEN